MYDPNTSGAGPGAKVCPVCRTPVQPNAQIISCPKCGVQHHTQCWQNNRGCGTPNCSVQPGAAPAQPGPAQPMQPQARPPQGQQSCQHCGYVLGPFDTTCPKCARVGTAGGPQQQPYGAQPGHAPQQPYGPSSYPPPQPPGYSPGYSAQYGKQPSAVYYDNAGFLIRLGASIIDALILSAVLFLLSKMMGVDFTNRDYAAMNPAVLAQMQSFQMVGNLLCVIYEVCLIGFVGATLGKMACSLRVVRTDGSDIGIGRALLRYVLKGLLAIPCFLTFWFILFHPEKRALHDIILDTQVIHQ